MPTSRSSQIAPQSNRQSSAQDTQAAANVLVTEDSQEEIQSDLSKRELQIVELVAAGLTNQEISEKLAISKRTVDNHVSNVLSKTNSGNRVALVRWALQSGKVCIDELNCCRLPDAGSDA
ncbi:MAG: LuxR C-terminal-related transcriptional regulator [Cyanobacteria bacterium P01_D01_bin.105]